MHVQWPGWGVAVCGSYGVVVLRWSAGVCCVCLWCFPGLVPAETALQRDAIGCYKDTQWLGMYRQSETRSGQHRRHTPTRNASLPTQANNIARGARKQPPPIRALYIQLAKIPHTHHTTPYATIAPGADKPARHPPRAQQVPAQRTHN